MFTYGELAARAAALSATLRAATPAGGPPLTGVLAHRSATAFAAVLGALGRGHGYVPLNPAFPPARTREMLRRAGCRAIVADRHGSAQLRQALEGIEWPLVVVLPEGEDSPELGARPRSWEVVGPGEMESAAGQMQGASGETEGTSREMPRTAGEDGRAPADDAVAYVMFTSGSTGAPKGVAVSHRNAVFYVDRMVEQYGITEHDRFSQTFDLTFDPSVFDMFVAWERGACLCCPSPKALLQPGRFIREAELSIWYSVPSRALIMKRLGMLQEGRYATLRWSFFVGEPLPLELAAAWARAAPHSVVENVYGPTEVTVTSTWYRWDRERTPAESELGVVPIGWPVRGMSALVVDPRLREVPPGEAGELLLSGPQVSLGYWNDPERTAQALVVPPGRREVHYRTGDRVRRPRHGEPLRYLGRVDDQVKVSGHRVELGEIEAVLREETGVDSAVALGWPRNQMGFGGVVAFLGDRRVDVEEARRRLGARLPEYMVPTELHLLDELPLNRNGKFDRRALLARLERGK